jgi:hypothetical protein
VNEARSVNLRNGPFGLGTRRRLSVHYLDNLLRFSYIQINLITLTGITQKTINKEIQDGENRKC